MHKSMHDILESLGKNSIVFMLVYTHTHMHAHMHAHTHACTLTHPHLITSHYCFCSNFRTFALTLVMFILYFSWSSEKKNRCSTAQWPTKVGVHNIFNQQFNSFFKYLTEISELTLKTIITTAIYFFFFRENKAWHSNELSAKFSER